LSNVNKIKNYNLYIFFIKRASCFYSKNNKLEKNLSKDFEEVVSMAFSIYNNEKYSYQILGFNLPRLNFETFKKVALTLMN